MVHLVTGSSEEAENWTLAKTLKADFGNLEVFAATAKPAYRSKWQLFFREYPKLFAAYAKLAQQSLTARQPAKVIITDTDVGVLAYAAMNRLMFKPKKSIVWLGYIYTERSGVIGRIAQRILHGMAISACDRIITYATSDNEACQKAFKRHSHKFIMTTYGIGLQSKPMDFDDQQNQDYIFTAGRSQRDYPVLAKAIKDLPYCVEVACDNLSAAPENLQSDQFRIYRHVHNERYIDMLKKAKLVVLPLKETTSSAGQMVMLHAMAYRKPIIVSDIASIQNYLIDRTAFKLVPAGDSEALKAAIDQVMKDAGLQKQLADRAGDLYDQYFTDQHLADAIVTIIKPLYEAAEGGPKTQSKKP